MGQEASEPRIGGTLGDSYRLTRRLERGGTGTVYEAEQLRVGRKVAVKIMRCALAEEPRSVRRFEREAEIISALEHPNTLKLFDFGRLDDGRPYLVTEFLEGRTLAERMAAGPLTVGFAARVAQDVLLSLSEAHSKGIIHRDLKPSNIFLHRIDSGERIRVLDFGIARQATSTTLTEPGMIMGTPAYMSPEQALKDEVDGRSDLYSLGAILFQMLTGSPPFAAPHPQTLILKHALLAPPRLRQVNPDLPVELDELVAHLLQKAPEARPHNALEVYHRLDPFSQDPTVAPVARPVSQDGQEAELLEQGARWMWDSSGAWQAPFEASAPPKPRFRLDWVSWMAASGLVMLLLALTLVAMRTLVPGRLALPDPARSHQASVRSPVVPALPTPVVDRGRTPAPLQLDALPEPELEPERSRPRAPGPPPRRRPPPGFVDVEL